MDLIDELDGCHDFGDIFELVKKAVSQSLGKRRVGLMLYLADLPRNVGAFHTVGSNAIVMNRRLLREVSSSVESLRDLNSYVFSILAHEYLHTLGYLDEREVRGLVRRVCIESFGEEHPASKISSGELRIASRGVPNVGEQPGQDEAEIVRDFDRSNQTYIA